MHFTLWPGARVPTGAHTEIDWPAFLSFVRESTIADDKSGLEGWSPAKFSENRRARAHVEAVSAIVLDDDSTGLPIDGTPFEAFAGVIHTSHSHTPEHPKYRIVLRCSRDMTPDEHARVWRWVRDYAAAGGQTIDEATKDPSRLWFVPAHRAGAPYEYHELPGFVLDVDRVLDLSPSEPVPDEGSRAAPQSAVPRLETGFGDGLGRRKAMAAALAAAWPAKGKGRHETQLALAGALRNEGWPEAEALEFLCDVCRLAGDENRPKRVATVEHTYSRPADAPLTGWTRLKRHIDPVVVDLARKGLGRDAEWSELLDRRMAEAAGAVESPHIALPAPVGLVTAGRFSFETGGYDAPLPPITWQIEGLIARGDVSMLVAHGNSLKTWLAFSLAHSIASGRPWLDRFPVRRGRAAILDFESGRYEVLRRLKLLGVKDEAVADRLLRQSYPSAVLTDPEAWVDLAGATLEFLAIDSFNAASPDQDENDARAALMLTHAGRFAEHTGCSVTVIHHARKGGGGDRRESVRGSTALYAACDRVFEFDEPERKDDGIIISTMRSIKDGAGRSPAPVRVELSDQGLRWLEPEKEPTPVTPAKEPPIKPIDEARAAALMNELRTRGDISQADLYALAGWGRRELDSITAELKRRGWLGVYHSEGRNWFKLTI